MPPASPASRWAAARTPSSGASSTPRATSAFAPSAGQAEEKRLALAGREAEGLADGVVTALAQHQLVRAAREHDALRQRCVPVRPPVDEHLRAGQVAAHLDLAELVLQVDEVPLRLRPPLRRQPVPAQVAAECLQRLPLLPPRQMSHPPRVSVAPFPP